MNRIICLTDLLEVPPSYYPTHQFLYVLLRDHVCKVCCFLIDQNVGYDFDAYRNGKSGKLYLITNQGLGNDFITLTHSHLWFIQSSSLLEWNGLSLSWRLTTYKNHSYTSIVKTFLTLHHIFFSFFTAYGKKARSALFFSVKQLTDAIWQK